MWDNYNFNVNHHDVLFITLHQLYSFYFILPKEKGKLTDSFKPNFYFIFYETLFIVQSW